MEGRVDFPTFASDLPGRFIIRLAKSPTGHVLLPGMITEKTLRQAGQKSAQVFLAQHATTERRKLADAEVLKIHQQLGHCSERQLAGLLKFGRWQVDSLLIQRIARRCNFQRSVRRITPLWRQAGLHGSVGK